MEFRREVQMFVMEYTEIWRGEMNVVKFNSSMVLSSSPSDYASFNVEKVLTHFFGPLAPP